MVGSLSVMTVMTADRYFNVRISHNTKRDLVTCDPREDPMCLVFFYRCLSLPNFSGHKRTLVSIRSVAPSSQNKLRHALHTVQPFKKPCSKITSHRGARTCRVHDLAVFKGRSKWPSLKKMKKLLAMRHHAARFIHPFLSEGVHCRNHPTQLREPSTIV